MKLSFSVNSTSTQDGSLLKKKHYDISALPPTYAWYVKGVYEECLTQKLGFSGYTGRYIYYKNYMVFVSELFPSSSDSTGAFITFSSPIDCKLKK